MTSAALLVAYALVVAFGVPPLLSRVTARGIAARWGLAAWLVAMLGVLAALAAAASFLLRPSFTAWRGGSEAAQGVHQTCRSVVRWMLTFETCAVLVVATAVGITAFVLLYARILRRAQRITQAHADTAQIAGRRLPTIDALVVDSPQPAAYCVPGRPPTIVVTAAALSVLEPAQLTAVLAHERAHLAGRHHRLVMLTRGLATLLPRVLLFRRGANDIARLTEICADDVASRRTSRDTLVAALLTMGTGSAVPAGALAASGTKVLARVQRLLEPPDRGDDVRMRLALAAVMAGVVATLVAVTGFAVALTGCGAVPT